LLNDDAMVACDVVEEPPCYTHAGTYLRFSVGHKGLYARDLEEAGYEIQSYHLPTEPIALPHRRPEKIRKAISGCVDDIDERTGRVYLGCSPAGLFYWDAKERMVYMRRPGGDWIGHFCQDKDWSEYRVLCSEYMPIPSKLLIAR
jgi:hypothetical protein